MGAFLVNDQEQVSIDISSAQIDRPQRNPAQGRTQLWFGMTAFCAAGVVAAGVLLGGGSRVLPSPSELTRAPTVVQTVTSAPKAMPHVQLEAVVIRPLAQQLAELERIRQAGVARATANATASLAATTAAPRAAAVVGF
jgi:hypothetical protein